MNPIDWAGGTVRFLAWGLVVCGMVLVPGCSDSPTDPDVLDATGSLVSHGECKYSETSSAMDGIPQNNDCIVFDYDGIGTLNLLHVNSAFNCCTELQAAISIGENIITIEEAETGEICRCICLYDVEYLVENLPPGAYQLTVTGCWLPEGEEPLVCQLDLGGHVSGECCIERQHYPWDG